MVDKALVIGMYLNGDTLASIGKYFGVSRQRISQIIKKQYSCLDFKNGREKHFTSIEPNRSEIFVFDKLTSMGLSPQYTPKASPYDILLNDKKIQVKYRGRVNPLNGNLYFKFRYLKERETPDFYIFVCGELKKPISYIVPSVAVGDAITIPFKPLNKNTRKFSRLYLENWYSLI